jgi:hypothetical protein
VARVGNKDGCAPDIAQAERGDAEADATGGRRQDFTARVQRRALQRRAARAAEAAGGEPAAVHDAAAEGLSGVATSLPHLSVIQASFGAEHDVSSVDAHVGGTAAVACDAIGASAYASGGAVAFDAPPDLHTAAHEAAHVVQQQRGVSLDGGVGEVGDVHEQHADRVADAVIRGDSAAQMLAEHGGGGAQHAVQARKKKKKAADDDWEVTQDPSPDDESPADAVIRMQPDDDRVTAPLGGDTEHTFSVEHASKHSKFEWTHRLRGAAAEGDELQSPETVRGRSSTTHLRPRVTGTKKMRTHLTEIGADGERTTQQAPEVTFETPRPTLTSHALRSEGAAGTRPVTKALSLGDELVVTMQLDDVEGSPSAHAAFKGENLAVAGPVASLGDGSFEVRLKAAAPGAATGKVSLTLAEMTHDEAAHLALDLVVEPPADPRTATSDVGAGHGEFERGAGEDVGADLGPVTGTVVDDGPSLDDIARALWGRDPVANGVIDFAEDLGNAEFDLAFLDGIDKGAHKAVHDLLKGLVDAAKMLWKVMTGGGAFVAMDLYETIKTMFKAETIRQLAKELGDGWTDPDATARGEFRGKVIGYIAAEAVIVVITDGVASEIAASGMFTELVNALTGTDALAGTSAFARGPPGHHRCRRHHGTRRRGCDGSGRGRRARGRTA